MAEFPRLSGLIEVGNAAGVRLFLQPGDNESSPSPVLKSCVGAVGEVLSWSTSREFKFQSREGDTTFKDAIARPARRTLCFDTEWIVCRDETLGERIGVAALAVGIFLFDILTSRGLTN